MFLKKLKLLNKEQIKRTLTAEFVKGKPNLLLCPVSDMLATIISIYAQNPDQPLPTVSEVLLCSPETTLEDVELFMKRAMLSCDG